MANRYEEALMAQDGCNLSGIVHALARAMDEINKEGADENVRRRDSAVFLFVDKIHSMVGSSMTDERYENCYQTCQELRTHNYCNLERCEGKPHS